MFFKKRSSSTGETKPSASPAATALPQQESSDSAAQVAGENRVKFEASVEKDADADVKLQKVQSKLAQKEEELKEAKSSASNEKAAKRKLYSSLVKLANELKQTRAESEELLAAAEYAGRAWYEGGMWRGPNVLPGLNDSEHKAVRTPVSLSDLFLDLVVVTAFTRVGVAIQYRGTVDGPILAYFAIFWFIWSKEASYSTRFDTTDLSSQIETLLACFAVLFGSLSCGQGFDSEDSHRIMIMAAFVSLMHFCLHIRVWLWFTNSPPDTDGYAVKNYALFIMGMTGMESLVWLVGIFFVPRQSEWRWLVFLIGVLLGLRVPKAFLPNDFHAACSKRGVLYILLLGFIIQSVLVVATPFFDYEYPSIEQYSFIGSACFLMYCIKLLYVDDTYSVSPQDHALLVNRTAGFFFHMGQFSLLLSTTVLGAGLDLLTHSYLAATAALPDNAKNLVCAGFSMVTLSTAFIKSMHMRRMPTNVVHQRMFIMAYSVQLVMVLAIVYTTAQMCFAENGFLAYLMLNEIEMLFVLCGFALILVVMSWLDEAVELRLYGDGADAREFRVHPFGLWWCLQHEEPLEELARERQAQLPDGRLAHLSPLLGASVMNLSGSFRAYNSIPNLSLDEGEEQAKPLAPRDDPALV